MSYIRKHGSGLMGLGATGTMCRTGAAFFQQGNWWVPIRDADGKEYPLMQTSELLALPMCSSGGGGGSWFDSLVKGATAVLTAKVTPGAVTNINTPGSPGMSSTTKMMIAGGAVVGGVLLLRALKK